MKALSTSVTLLHGGMNFDAGPTWRRLCCSKLFLGGTSTNSAASGISTVPCSSLLGLPEIWIPTRYRGGRTVILWLIQFSTTYNVLMFWSSSANQLGARRNHRGIRNLNTRPVGEGHGWAGIFTLLSCDDAHHPPLLPVLPNELVATKPTTRDCLQQQQGVCSLKLQFAELCHDKHQAMEMHIQADEVLMTRRKWFHHPWKAITCFYFCWNLDLSATKNPPKSQWICL